MVFWALQALPSLELKGRRAKFTSQLISGLPTVRACTYFEEIIWTLCCALFGWRYLARLTPALTEEISSALLAQSWIGEASAWMARTLSEIKTFALLTAIFVLSLFARETAFVEKVTI